MLYRGTRTSCVVVRVAAGVVDDGVVGVAVDGDVVVLGVVNCH